MQVAVDDTLVETYLKSIKPKYGSLFKSLDIEVGFARFLRVLMAYESLNEISQTQLRQILPNTSTNESLRILLENQQVETKK